MSKITYGKSADGGLRWKGTPVFFCESCKKRFQTKKIAINHRCKK